MLCKIAIILFLIGYSAQGINAEDGSNTVTFSNRLKHVIEKKCLANADRTKYNEVLKILDHLQNECMLFEVAPGGISDTELSKRCYGHTTGVKECLATFVNTLEPCLNSEEIYLKQFILDVYNSSSGYFCEHIQVLSVSELLHKNGEKFLMFQNHPETDPHRVCYENSTVLGDNPSVDIITKVDLCNDVLQINFCYDDVLNKYCSDVPEIRFFQSAPITAGLQNCMDVLVHGATEITKDITEPTQETK